VAAVPKRVKCFVIVCLSYVSPYPIHTALDKTVLSVSNQPRRCRELDSRQLKTVADRKYSLNTLIAIVQFTPPRQTRHNQNCFVVSAVWCVSVNESAHPIYSCVSVSGLRRSALGVRSKQYGITNCN